jgi:hypothetical protein
MRNEAPGVTGLGLANRMPSLGLGAKFMDRLAQRASKERSSPVKKE